MQSVLPSHAALQAACEGKTHSLKGLDVAAVTADLAKLSPAEAAALAARMDALRPSLDVDALARSLLDPLARTRSLADAGDALTLDAAYAIQKRCRELREAGGERVVGHKVGCASEAVRASLGVASPVRGDLWEREQRVDGAVVALARFAELAVEGELCLELFHVEGAVEEMVCCQIRQVPEPMGFEPTSRRRNFASTRVPPPSTCDNEILLRLLLNLGNVSANVCQKIHDF